MVDGERLQNRSPWEGETMPSAIGSSGELTSLGIVGLKAAQKSQATQAQVVLQAAENAKQIASSAAAPSGGRGQIVDTSA